MPFAGDRAAAEAAMGSLRALAVRAGDELILVDNSSPGATSDLHGDDAAGPIRVLVAGGERSPAHARNVGAAAAQNEWILFLDADTVPGPGLLEAFFRGGVGDDVGAVAGEVHPAPGEGTLSARYGAARSFLGQRSHYEHPYRPRAAAANLLVRRAAFEQLGGFYEGVRAGEDTDFTWRLQEAGWQLDLRPQAVVVHRYRARLGELRRQWRGYAAGRAWLGRRYPEFHPQPAVKRALGRARKDGLAHLASGGSPRAASKPGVEPAGRLERTRFLALDVLLALEELAGLTLSNRPRANHGRAGLRLPRSAKLGRGDHVDVVLVADRFPVRDDPLVELAGTLERVRVEAMARPAGAEAGLTSATPVEYLEDEGAASRWAAAMILTARHPLRTVADLLSRPPDVPPLRALAPAVRRLERDSGARVHPLGATRDHGTAERLARLAGRRHSR